MSEHTRGKLKLGRDGLSVSAVEDGYELFSIPDDEDYGRPGEDQANAERIVSCWNACEGFEDPSVVPEMLKALKRITEKKGFCLGSCYSSELEKLVFRAEGRCQDCFQVGCVCDSGSAFGDKARRRKYAGDAI